MATSISIQNSDFALAVIQITDADISNIINELTALVPNQHEEETLRFIPCVLDIEPDVIEPTFLAQIVELLRQYSFLPIGLKSEDESLSEQAAYAGLAMFNDKLNQLALFESFNVNEAEVAEPEIVEPMLHHANVEEGQQVYAANRDLVVLGDVAKGAEVIADGSIYIGGSLFGKAYAGNSGLMNIDQNSVRAYVFEPELVSIAGFYQLDEDIPRPYKGLPVKAKFIGQKFEYALEQ